MIKVSRLIRECQTLSGFLDKKLEILKQLESQITEMARQMLVPQDVAVCQCGSSLDWFEVQADSQTKMMIASCSKCARNYQRSCVE